MMARHDPISGKRIIVEGAVVVVSILLAFGIDAWWAERQLRTDELAALRSLLVELEANRAVIDESVEMHGSRSNAAQRLLHVSLNLTQAPEAPGELSDLLQEGAARYLLTNVAGGDLTALLSSGDIGNIRNPEIRRRIAELPSIFEDARENEEQFATNHHQNFYPFVLDRLPALTLSFPLVASQLPPGEGTVAADSQISELLGDDQLESILANAILLHGSALRALVRVRDSLDRLIELIEVEVGA